MTFPFHQAQLQFMIDLARNRIEALNPLFIFLNYFDSPYFAFFLIPIVWLGVSYRWGLRVFYLMLVSYLVNGSLKMAIGWPRPSTDLPEIGLFHFKSPGFPSGGAQTAFLLGGVLIYYWRTKWAWVVGISYILLISFSRLYLGVHYPLDILGGWLAAGLILIGFIFLRERIESYLQSQGLGFCLGVSLGIPMFLFFGYEGSQLDQQIAAASAIAIGTFLSLKYELFLADSKNWAEGAGRAFFGVSVVGWLLFICPKGCSVMNHLFLGFWVSLIASPIYRKIQWRNSWFG